MTEQENNIKNGFRLASLISANASGHFLFLPIAIGISQKTN